MLDLFVGDVGGIECGTAASAEDHVGETFLANELDVGFGKRAQHSKLRLPFLRRLLRLRGGSNRQGTHEGASSHAFDCTGLRWTLQRGSWKATLRSPFNRSLNGRSTDARVTCFCS